MKNLICTEPDGQYEGLLMLSAGIVAEVGIALKNFDSETLPVLDLAPYKVEEGAEQFLRIWYGDGEHNHLEFWEEADRVVRWIPQVRPDGTVFLLPFWGRRYTVRVATLPEAEVGMVATRVHVHEGRVRLRSEYIAHLLAEITWRREGIAKCEQELTDLAREE